MENTSNINQILNKYWEGETSLKEEARLKAYFRSGDIEPAHRRFAPLFGLFEAEKSVSADVDLETPLRNTGEKKEEEAVVRRLSVRRYAIAIAAVMTLILSAVVVFNTDNASTTQYQGKYTEITDEEEALEMTKNALAFLTKKMDTSTRQVSEKVKMVEKVDIFK